MPIYEYSCHACGYRFEELVSLAHAQEPQACPSCGGQDTERLVSRFAPHVARAAGAESSAGKNCAGCSRSSCATCR